MPISDYLHLESFPSLKLPACLDSAFVTFGTTRFESSTVALDLGAFEPVMPIRFLACSRSLLSTLDFLHLELSPPLQSSA